jgi:sulfoquinovosyltransferase
VRLAIVGKGPAEAELKKYFEGTATKFMGLLQGDRLSQAFASGDLFVMPSDSETLGFVVIESMASGVPVVGARAGGVPSIISDGETGLLANPRDPQDFLVKVRSLLQDKPRLAAMALAARAVTEKWGWEAATMHLRNVQYPLAKSNFRLNRDINPAASSNLFSALGYGEAADEKPENPN